MKKRKGQAAIEFLTTYSWAIMGILLTIGALTYFDVFNTNRFISERCETGDQIGCVEAAMTENGRFSIRLANNFPVNITITRMTLKNDLITDYGDNTAHEFERGETKRLNYDIGPVDFSSSMRETFEVAITFRRTDGSNNYTINGNLVVRPLPAGMI